jgi:hypothetical protein
MDEHHIEVTLMMGWGGAVVAVMTILGMATFLLGLCFISL